MGEDELDELEVVPTKLSPVVVRQIVDVERKKRSLPAFCSMRANLLIGKTETSYIHSFV